MTLSDVHSIPSLLRLQAERFPNKVFLFFKEQEVTYRQLDERTERIAENLARFKIQPGERVVLLLPNIPEFLFAFFGVLKRGATVVPIHPQLKGEEVVRLLEHSESRVLMTTPALYSMVASMIAPKRAALPRLELLFLVGERGGVGKVFSSLYVAGGPRRSEEISSNDPAGLIYTTAATGLPNGVLLTDRNYLFSAAQFAQAMEMTERDRFLSTLSLSGVGSQVMTLLAPLFSGGSLVLMERFSPNECFITLERFRATAFFGLPAIYEGLLQIDETREHDLSSLRFCLNRGTPLPVALIQTFEERFQTSILEGYGPAEGTGIASVNRLSGRRKIGSVGVPFSGLEMRIFNDQDEALPDGEIGEVVLRGENVMAGYFKAEAEEPIRSGWLHTGDLGYRDDDGFFFIVGRKER